MKHYPALRRLQQFQHLSRSLNFRQSAQELAIAQPALTRSIQQLEEELGFVLFQRSTRSTEATPAALHLLRALDQIFPQLEQAIRESRNIATDRARHKLLVGYSAQAANSAMPELLFGFGVRHPKVELNLLQMPSELIYEEVGRGDLDAGFALRPAPAEAPAPGAAPQGWEASARSLPTLPVDAQPLVALCARSHPLAARARIALGELQEQGLILGSRGRWGIFRGLVDALFRRHHLSPLVVYEPDDTPILLEHAARSDHLALYGGGIRGKLPPELVAIAFEESDAVLHVDFVHRPFLPAGRGDDSPLRVLADIVQQHPQVAIK